MSDNVLNISVDKFKDQYLNFLKNNIDYRQVNDDIISVTTPFLDRNNDFTEIYIIDNHDGRFTITDEGYTINDLELSGCELKSPKRVEILQNTINRYGIMIGSNQCLYTTSALQDMPTKKHMLIQCMIAVNDLHCLSRNSVLSYFIDDVIEFFDRNEVRYIQDVSFSGKAQLSHNFEFVIPKTRKAAERIIKVISDPHKQTNIDAALFALTDIQNFRREAFTSYALLDDSEKRIKENELMAFKNYNVIPLPWSDKGNFIDELAM